MKKYIIGLSIILFAVIIVANIAHANPSFFGIQKSTSTATSTISQIIAGTATTTLTFDALENGRQYAVDSSVLLLQSTASSTASVINIALQYSQDGVDWYSNNLALPTATTTVDIGTAQTYTFTASNTSLTKRIVSVPTPTRFVRAVISATASSSTIWASILPKIQTSSF